MTRKEAYERNNCGDDEIVDIIFDDLESKTCENCKYWDGECSELCYFTDGGWTNNYFETDKDFSCNKWEKRN